MNPAPATPAPVETLTIKDRLRALLQIVLQHSKLNPLFVPTIRNLANNFIDDMQEAEIKNAIIELRDRFIPWLLGEVVTHENPVEK